MKTGKIKSIGIFAILLLFITSISSGCMLIDGVEGNGRVVTEERNVSDFNGIDISNAFEVILKQGSSESLTIEADDNLLELIVTEVRGGVLKIYSEKNIRHPKSLKIFLTFKEIDYIDISGAVELTSDGKLTFDKLEIDGSGASEIDLELSANRLDIDFSGASEIDLKGKVTKVNIDISGASEISAYDLETDFMNLDISGAGEARVFVNEELNVEASGAASVRYKGNPSIDTNVSGAGSVKRY